MIADPVSSWSFWLPECIFWGSSYIGNQMDRLLIPILVPESSSPSEGKPFSMSPAGLVRYVERSP
jgi:hypothetical protein